jgi:hypothetical protein
MTSHDIDERRRRRDACSTGAQLPGAAERALLHRMEQLRPLVAEYEELRRWAERLGVDVNPPESSGG